MEQIIKCLVSEENIKRSGDKRTKSQRRRKVQKAASPDLYCQRRPKIWRFQTTEKIKKSKKREIGTRNVSQIISSRETVDRHPVKADHVNCIALWITLIV